MSERAPPFLVVGHVSKAHGTRGEVFVWPLTDHPESSFAPGVILRVGDDSGDAPSAVVAPLEVEAVRPFQRGYLVHFAGIGDRNAADLLRGRYLLRPAAQIEPRHEGEFFYHELLGLRVVTVAAEPVGEVVEVYELEPAHLLEVRRERGAGTVLVPFSREVVREVDLAGRRVVVDPPEGLLDLP